jgi:hypothetical protein
LERKPELLRSLNEFQIGDFMLVIESIAAVAPGRARQQPRLFVKTNCIDAQARFLSDLADLER